MKNFFALISFVFIQIFFNFNTFALDDVIVQEPNRSEQASSVGNNPANDVGACCANADWGNCCVGCDCGTCCASSDCCVGCGDCCGSSDCCVGCGDCCATDGCGEFLSGLCQMFGACLGGGV